MFQAFALVWQTAQNYCQSCLYPTNCAWPAFLTPFLLPLPVSGHLSRGFTLPPTKRAYSALHPQALTECNPLDFRRSSIKTNIACTYWGWGDSLHLAQWLERRTRDRKVPGLSPRSNQSLADDTILMISSPTDVKMWIWNWSLNSVTSSSEKLVSSSNPITNLQSFWKHLVTNCRTW